MENEKNKVQRLIQLGSGRRSVVFLSFCFLLLTLSGCASMQTLPPPDGWPVSWKSRLLYNTPHAYIYASNSKAAKEMDRLVQRVLRDFENDNGTQPAKGLIIASDIGDELPVADMSLLFNQRQKEMTELYGDDAPSQQQLLEQWEEQQHKVESMGLQMEVLFKMTPIPLDNDDLTQVCGLGPEVTQVVPWGMMLPTKGLMQQANNEISRATLASQGASRVGLYAMAPVLFLKDRRATDAMAVTRDIALYQHWAEEQNWNRQKKCEVVEDYTEQKKEASASVLLTAIKTLRFTE